jgi:hypothetical protein
MVEIRRDTSHSDPEPDRSRSLRFPWKIISAAAAILLVLAGWGLTSAGRNPSVRASTPRSGVVTSHSVGVAHGGRTNATTSSVSQPVATTTSTSEATSSVKPPPVPVPPIAAPLVAARPVVVPPIAAPGVAALVAEVEASGIVPGSNWSWSMGDTAAHCGPMTGAGTGCTYGLNGLEYTVFSGSPTLALVAHELANAETQNDAVPNLLNEVAVAAAGSSWSQTDAVASCLVAYFMGFQDESAGSWQCPVALAATVATNIHDSL